MNVEIQSLFTYNPKTKEYLVRIGSLLFPFKSADEVLAYFLGLSKIKKLINQKMNNEKCKFNLKENAKTKSIYCTKLEQWISQKYCVLCRFYEPNNNNNKLLLHSYNYNYSIAHNNNEGEGGIKFLLPSKFLINFRGE
jgi:hypothetical protein